MNKSDIEKVYYILISLLALLTPFALFLFRSLDDNRLTSWQWVFPATDATWVLLILIPALILAYALSRSSFLHDKPVFLFLSSFFLAAFFWKEPEVILDASRYFTQAKHLHVYGVSHFLREWGNSIMAWTDMPLVPFLYGLIFKLLGEHRIYIQIFTTLLFSSTVVLTYMIGKTLWNRDIGFLAGLLLLGIPYLFTQVPLMLVDIPTMFFVTLAIFTVIKALNQGGMCLIGVASVALFLAIFCKYSTWLWLSILVIIFLVNLATEGRKTVKRGVTIILLSLFLVVPVILLQYDVISDQISLLLNYQRPGLQRWTESFISTFFFQSHPFIALTALYSIYVAFKQKDVKFTIISFLFFLVILLQIRRIRYILPLFPLLTLMASYGLSEIKTNRLRKFVAFSIVISSFVISYSGYLPFLERMSAVNIKKAGELIDSLDATNVEVYTLRQEKSVVNPAVSVPLLDLFTEKELTYHPDRDARIAWERIRRSAVRFTWEYRNPEYYGGKNKDRQDQSVLVVIASAPNQSLPKYIEQRGAEYSIAESFNSSTGVFRYRTTVTVYHD